MTVGSQTQFSERVLRAMARWPNVPSVYNWLALDRRGRWSMRGAPVSHPGLIDFINRHYLADAMGRYYFQNGPQKVYVEMEGTPFILSIQPNQARGQCLVSHTGRVVEQVSACYLLDDGGFALMADLGPAEIDDRDLGLLEEFLEPPTGESVEEALARIAAGECANLWFCHSGQRIVVASLGRSVVPARLGFVSHPQPGENETEYCN